MTKCVENIRKKKDRRWVDRDRTHYLLFMVRLWDKVIWNRRLYRKTVLFRRWRHSTKFYRLVTQNAAYMNSG